ncbi:sodium:alanine symporter [Deferribacter desulfuricans SSM1]|uniref:Sodium:alanine symporter n=1 Tax=Deferribacter desulfuricans (strain DSM 14783 / JCM 11476 / NBRC 101012 / SSM1) TaxID=639282 RepID=D3P8L9_DEFDS|nr:sodium:alanine symporter family protein [Deferribacter desulfuricans]BAI81059.1 sodium:alanine symporter [Deferribacter desulfuricans SSM1]
MEKLHSIINYLDSIVWGPFMLVLLIGTGVLITLRLGFIQVRLLPKALKLIFFKGKSENVQGDITPFQALTTALSATIGTGNIAGVATAIATGGPGAIFWMWLSAFFGMATKYAEAVLAVNFRKKLEDGTSIGGPMYYLKEGLSNKFLGNILGVLFAIFGIVASFGIGSMVQSHSVAMAVNDAFNLPKGVTGFILMVLTALVIIGGIKRIGKVTEKIVPFMAVFYFIFAIIIIVLNFGNFLDVLVLIFKSAFSPVAAVGGFAGAAVKDAIRYGVARGVFSNEAGLGSAPIAHAAAKTDNPVRQGLVAMTGVFFDTIIICSLTAFVILLTGVWDSGKTSTELTAMAFVTVFGGNGKMFLALALIFFAYSTILGWSYYGEQCAKFLFGYKFSYFYKIVYSLSVFYGAFRKTAFVWDMADLFNGMMAIPNLIGLIFLSGLLVKITKEKIDEV